MKFFAVVLVAALVACGTSNTGKPIASDKCERAFVRMLPVLQRITARNPRREIEACRDAGASREAWLDCILSIPSGHMSVETIQDCQSKDRQARGGAASAPTATATSSAPSESSSSEVSR